MVRAKYSFLVFVIIFFLLELGADCTSVRAAAAEDLLSSIRESCQVCWDDTKWVLAAPGQWGREEWFKAALALGATLVLAESDSTIREHFQTHQSESGDTLSGIFAKVGNVGYLAPALGLWYLYGKTAENLQIQEAALVSLESLIISGGITGVLKLSFHRSRPDTGNGSHSFDGPGFSWDDSQLSFPSMHSAAAFSVATVLADYYREQRWVPFFAYTAATMVALSRIYDDRHWSSDVGFGAAVGYYTAKKLLTLRAAGRTGAERLAGAAIVPVLTPLGAGLAVEYRF